MLYTHTQTTHTHTHTADKPELPAAQDVRPQLKGYITITMPDGTDIEVDANAYVSELSQVYLNTKLNTKLTPHKDANAYVSELSQ
jgi:hypothetical protein